jgi:hypothetical protein
MLAGLPGCDGGSAPPPGNEARVKLRNVHQEKLLALPEDLRRIGLMRSIRNTQNRCPRRVESALYQQEYGELAMWTARCDDNRQWAIFISASGHVQVRDCEQMERLGLPRSRELPPAPQRPPEPKARPGAR